MLGLKKSEKETATPRIISAWEHCGWGNSIRFFDWEKRKVTGHMSPLPKVGDVLRSKMASGKIKRFKFEEVRAMIDPRDQFFAIVSDLEYEE